LVNSGSYDGLRHHQFLIIDQDFDGLEDLYDREIDHEDIALRYAKMKNENPEDPIFYTVVVEAVEGGEILGGGEYTAGEEITISAVPDDGYQFVRWAGDLNGTEDTKTFSIQENLTVGVVFKVLKNPYFWEQATDLGQGWKLLDWFGYYYLPNPSNCWIYHSLFGWIYLIEISNSSFWLYSDEYGWLWSRKDIFPIFYSTDKTGWIYLENERYYDYSKRVWVD